MILGISREVTRRDKHHLATLAIASLYVFAIARIVAEFVDQDYNWDVDTYIYYGQQLLRGDPVWMSEWTGDPLVLRDFILALDSSFGPLLTWRLISLGSALLAVICVAILLPGFLKKSGYPEGDTRRAAMLSVGLYLLVSGHMPGGFTHINVLPSSMAIIALLLGFALLDERRNRWEVFALLIFASFAATISISVRQYFIFPLAMNFIVLGFLIFAERKFSVRQRITRVLLLLLTPTVLGIGLNLGPYLFLGKGWEFFTQVGFRLQIPPAGEVSLIDVFTSMDYGIHPGVRFWLIAMLTWSLVEIGMAIRRGSTGLIALLVPLSALMTAVGILSVYFWDHYTNFFSWYFSIILASRLILFDRVITVRMKSRLRPFLAPSVLVPFTLSTLAAIVLLAGVGPTQTAKSIAMVERIHPELALVESMKSRFASVPPYKPSFLVPQSQYVHWMLGEPRHGFPNSHWTNRILRGDWENLPPREYTFRTPKNADEYCAEILESSIEVVVLEDSYPLQSCFADAGPPWSREPVFVSGDEAWSLWWRNAYSP